MKQTHHLKIKHLNVSYKHHHALKQIELDLELSGITGIVGPNGAGKSTLLKTMCGLLKTESGELYLNDTNFQDLKSSIAYVPQKREMNLDFPILVEEVVAQGALAKKKWYQSLHRKDFLKAHDILQTLDLSSLAKKPIGQLSGGQQQRVFLARAIMQEAKVLCLDEPFVGLDVVSEEKLIGELKKLAQDGLIIFIVHHDLNAWRRYFDQLILLKTHLVASGNFHDVFTQDNLYRAYGINLKEM